MEQKKMKKITFLDTTLRDGEQAPGNSMNAKQKLKLALLLEKAGIETIETGFPASSKEDFEATRMISKSLTTASFATFSRTCIEDVKIALEAGGISERHLVMLVATGSDLHLENKRHISRAEGLKEIEETVMFVKKEGISNIAVGIEDASRGKWDYIEQIIDTAINSGANQIILADTTGFATPDNFGELIRLTREKVGPDIKISTHCHNDLGLAAINSFEAIKYGADEIQATICGIGERAGNTSLEQMVALLYYKGEKYGVQSNIQLNKLYEIYCELRKCIGLEESRMQPLLGKYVFSTSAGIHQQGIINNPETYEYVKASDLGRERTLLVDRHSGRNVIKKVIKELDIIIDNKRLNNIYEKYILKNSGQTYDLNTLKNLIVHELGNLSKEKRVYE